MADDRGAPGDPRRRIGESDSTNLLRDLRSLREVSPRESLLGTQQPRPAAPRTPSSARFVLPLLVLVLSVVAAASYRAHELNMRTPASSRTDSPGPVSPATPMVSRTAGSPATPVAAPPQPGEIEGVSRGAMVHRYLLAQWLLRVYGPAVSPDETFASTLADGFLPCEKGPGVFFGRQAGSTFDEIDAVTSAMAPATEKAELDRRAHVRDALVGLAAAATSPVDRAIAWLVVGDASQALASLPADAAAAGLGGLKAPVVKAMAQAFSGEDLAQCDQELGRAADDPLSLLLRASIAVVQGKKDQAAKLLGEVSEKSTSPVELFAAAGFAMRLAALPVAAGLAEKARTLAPQEAATAYLLGVLAEKKGDLAKARTAFSDAIAAKGTDARLAAASRVRRALVDEKADAPSIGSDGDLRAAEETLPSDAGLALGWARSSFRRSDFKEALGFWQRVVVIQGPDEENLVGLTRCYDEIKDQAVTRQGVTFLGLLVDHKLIASAPHQKRVEETLSQLKERLKPRPIYEVEQPGKE